MEVGRIKTSSVDIMVSGLRAEARKMNVTAANIANASTTRTENGEPYRRQFVVTRAEADGQSGVEVEDVQADMSTDFKRVYEPGNPMADANGFVAMPNVEIPTEMMNMVSASRAYQANAAMLKRYQESVDLTLELLR